MKIKNYLPLIIFILLISFSAQAQLEKVIVEKYYVADSADAADTTFGRLEVGSTTYRVYIDLKAGSKLKKIYGDVNHALKISSTTDFYNHLNGQSFAKDFPNLNTLKQNTTALDTWLTIGQLTKISLKTFFGILKDKDRDGNSIAGIKNSGQLLSNDSQELGIPLTTSDGLDTMIVTNASWSDNGIKDLSTGEDSTIFGSLKSGYEFISNDVFLANQDGITGVIPDSNQILIAQFTTKGQLSFEINVEVAVPGTGKDLGTYVIEKYVANDSILLSDEKSFRGLKYPYVQMCGCPDANYLEYKDDRDCDSKDSCRTRILFGCMDTTACNFDPTATVNVKSLCCYPGLCQDRDLALLCPSLIQSERSKIEIALFPNPVQEILNIQFKASDNKESKYKIYDSFGRVVFEKNIGIVSTAAIHQVDISNLTKGVYILRFFIGDNFENKTFIKN